MALYDFLTDTVPDYPQYFLINDYVVDVIPLRNEASDVDIHRRYGRMEGRTLRASESRFWIDLNLCFNHLQVSDREYLFDFYNDPDKACGSYRSFYYQMMSTFESGDHTYVVRFDSSLAGAFQNFRLYRSATLSLYVLGRLAE